MSSPGYLKVEEGDRTGNQREGSRDEFWPTLLVLKMEKSHKPKNVGSLRMLEKARKRLSLELPEGAQLCQDLDSSPGKPILDFGS